MLSSDAAPVARCVDNLTVELDEDGNADFSSTDLNAGSSDDNTPMEALLLSFDPAKDSLDCRNVGIQAVSLIVTDNVGQADTCFTQVTVEDNIDPTITCQSVTLELDPVAGAIALSLITSGALIAQNDNCALRGPEVTGPLTYDCTHLGENNETITMADVNGNETTCDIVVTIIDPVDVCSGDTPPLARCFQSLTVQIDADGELLLEPADLNNGSSDVETAPEDLLLAIDFGEFTLDCDAIGQSAQPVALLVTDNNGQTETCFTQVTVEDNIAPEVSCQNAVVELDASGIYRFSFEVIRDVFLTDYVDNCTTTPANIASTGEATIACDQLGLDTLDFLFRDGNGQEDRCDNVRIQITDPLGVCGEDPVALAQPFTVVDALESTVVLNANVFDDGSTDDRSVYTLVYSDETDRQENTDFACSLTAFNPGQTFTAGQTGVIQSIKVRSGTAVNSRLFLFNGNVVNDPRTVEDYAQDVELFFGQYDNRANLSVILLEDPFPVIAGQEYSFFLQGDVNLSHSCGDIDAYPGGQSFNGLADRSNATEQDLTFEVNIIGPTEAEFPSVGRTDLTVFAVDDQGNVSEGVPTSVNPDQALPVEWLSFGATAGAKQVDLQWETTEEPDNAGFHVERSAGGLRWEVLAEVDARLGSDQGYNFVDSAPLNGSNFYRIRQTDFDGELTYSSVEQVFFRAEDGILIYPNPADKMVYIGLPDGARLLDLIDVSGREVKVSLSGSTGQTTADLSELPQGLYLLRVELASGAVRARRLIVR